MDDPKKHPAGQPYLELRYFGLSATGQHIVRAEWPGYKSHNLEVAVGEPFVIVNRDQSLSLCRLRELRGNTAVVAHEEWIRNPDLGGRRRRPGPYRYKYPPNQPQSEAPQRIDWRLAALAVMFILAAIALLPPQLRPSPDGPLAGFVLTVLIAAVIAAVVIQFRRSLAPERHLPLSPFGREWWTQGRAELNQKGEDPAHKFYLFVAAIIGIARLSWWAPVLLYFFVPLVVVWIVSARRRKLREPDLPHPPGNYAPINHRLVCRALENIDKCQSRN